MMSTEIREARKVKGWTLVQLAVEVGVSVNTVRMWESGASRPSPDNSIRLREVLHIGEG